MARFSPTYLLLTPSVVSGGAVIFVTLLVVGGMAWSYITTAQLFYDMFFGYQGIATALVAAPDAFAAARGLLANPLMYYLMILAGGACIAFIVFETLQWLSQPHHINKPALQEVLVRLFVRLLALVGWCVYMVFFAGMLIPFTTLVIGTGLEQVGTNLLGGVVYIACALVLQAVALHTHIVFARLVLLRPRIFGGWVLEE